MAIVIELRDHYQHAGITLMHSCSEDVVVADVFGVIKNLPHSLVLWPWLAHVTGKAMPAENAVSLKFWESQTIPVGRPEGSTKVDVEIVGPGLLVFIEAKLGAGPSSGTANNPDRDQLSRNLDVGYTAAARAGIDFMLVYLTDDESEPVIVKRIRSRTMQAGSSECDSTDLARRLHWTSWASLGDAIANAYRSGTFSPVEASFALDVLAYLAKKRLWQNTLEDEERFSSEKLLAPLRAANSKYLLRYLAHSDDVDQSFRSDADQFGAKRRRALSV